MIQKNAEHARDKMALLDFSKTYKPFLYPWAVENW